MKNKTRKTNFITKVVRKLQRQGFTVTGTKLFGVDLVSTNPVGKSVAVIVKPHGHLTTPEKRQLLRHHMPIYIAREMFTGDSKIHAVKVEKII